jgi:hypothetical protein
MADEQWYIDNVPLRTLGWDIQAVSAGHGLPPIRGSNQIIPFRQGRRSYSKTYDERSFALQMYVVGSDPSGGIPLTPTGLEQLYNNLATLRQLFGRRSGLLTLKRVMPDGAVRTAQAEVTGTVDFDSVRGNMARFVVDFVLPDPFWYAPSAAASVSWTASGQVWNVTHPGNFETSNLVINITGGCTNPKIELGGTTIFVQVLVTNVVGDILLIDCQNFTATKNGSSVLGSVSHQGDPSFFKLFPGVNALTLTSGVAPTTNTVTITWPANYL